MSSISVTNRINIGYALLTCAILSLAGMAYVAVNQLGKSYQDYRSTTQQTLLISGLVSDIVDGRAAALKYRITPSDALDAEVRRNFDAVAVKATDPLVATAPEAVQSEIANVASMAVQYQSAFNETVRLRSKITQTATQVQAHYDAVIAALWELENVGRPGQSFNDILAESTQRTTILTNLQLGHEAAERYVANGDPSQLEASNIAFDEASASLREMDSSGGSTEEPWMVEVATHVEAGLAAITALKDSLDVTQADWNMVGEANEAVLDVVGPAMKQSLEAAVSRIVTTQENLGAAGQSVVDRVLSLTPMIGGAAFILAILIAFAIGRWVTVPLRTLAKTTQALADGNTSVMIEGREHKHELGQMARALNVFRDTIERDHETAVRTAQENAEQELVVTTLSNALKALADGNLDKRLNQKFKDSYEPLRLNFNTTLDRLEETMQHVISAAKAVESGVGKINNASQDLSERTANQAATLEQSAAALDELTVSIKSSAEQNKEVDHTVQQARQEAKASEAVVSDAVMAMGRIEESSAQISQITDVISDISFQTNLLALNAGVEAARAGEAGRGFAVVASEVRALAQRSSEAAREVSDLIEKSTSEVAEGTKLVNHAGDALVKIVAAVDSVSQLISEITSRSAEQATGLTEINVGINMLDEVTQKNAGMVDMSFAQGQRLVTEAQRLEELINQFQITHSGTGSSSPRLALSA
ncbi:HAMP domain-containing methyl-accepting chemotaxis protein [Yoonia sp. BS5-3]|uniref:Methyl-accepting chemotaxis protein n=1 Tax=Yoonia phaeophyticola TaxID=3137369 RepID=A0ABZ2V132_9RHOB